MKKLTALLALILTLSSAAFAQAGVYVAASVGVPAYCPPPVRQVYVPARVERRWVPGHGRVVVRPTHRVLAYNRYYHRWM